MGHVDPKATEDEEKILLQLRLQEYIALRAEQRTRLDGANRIIQYYTAIIGGLFGGLIALYRADATSSLQYQYIISLVALWLPAITMPFALTQHNEELFVLRIGKYLERSKRLISYGHDVRYWDWESFHYHEPSRAFWISGIFRSGLLLMFAITGFLVGVVLLGIQWSLLSHLQRCGRVVLAAVDALLITFGAITAVSLGRRRRKAEATQRRSSLTS